MCDKNCKGKDITEIVDLEMNSVLKFMLQEGKKQRKSLVITVWLLIAILFCTVIYYEWSFKAFMSQYDYENTITTTTETNNNSKINNNHNTNAQNNININIPKVKK